MGIQRKPKSSLLDLIESQPGRDAPRKVTHTKPPTPPLALPSQMADLKRKREQKEKEVMGAGQTLPPREDEAQRASKQAKTGQKGVEKRSDPQIGPLAWLPALMLNRESLLANASIHDFQGGTTSYVADVLEQALLLLEDMVELRGMRRHEVFLNLKRYLAMVCPFPFSPICFLYPLSLILVSFLGKLFKPPSG